MKIAVMQPYFFPYLGYFQLVRAVDQFVFFDDVNFIKKGWIHRNQILLHQAAHMFSIPLTKVSQNRKICDIELSDYQQWSKDFLRQLEYSYKKAPQFVNVFSWLATLFNEREYTHISQLAINSVAETFSFLGLEQRFIKSSELPYQREEGTTGQEKILSICKLLGSTTYINPKNGVDLYDNEVFRANNIDLKFIYMSDISYPQFKKDSFVPYLSMLDVLMFNEPSTILEYLNQYTLK